MSDLELFGRKTFFIAASEDLVPESYLPQFIEQGFETYLISANDERTMKDKVANIIRMFPNSILYFCIDKDFTNWKSYLSELKNEQKNDFLLGIVFESRNDGQAERIKSEYNRVVRVDAGYLALKPNDAGNFLSIQTELSKLKAKGRRNSVRAECDSRSRVEFTRGGVNYKARLLDVNETNFSCHIEDIAPDFPVFEQLHGITMFIEGLTLRVSAALIMKRLTTDEKKCIFMFIKEDGTPDLDEENAKLLSKKISEIIINRNMAKLNAAITPNR